MLKQPSKAYMNMAASIQQAFLDFSAAEEQVLHAVYQRIEDNCRDVLALQCSTNTMLVMANSDDDTIAVYCRLTSELGTEGLQCVSSTSPWAELLGRELDCGWVSTNQQGYCDGVVLSFGSLTPTLMLYVIGSTIRLMRVTSISS